jgi:acyl-CoA hydrolase
MFGLSPLLPLSPPPFLKANLDMIDRRYPHQVGKNISKGINEGRIRFAGELTLLCFTQTLQLRLIGRAANISLALSPLPRQAPEHVPTRYIIGQSPHYQ